MFDDDIFEEELDEEAAAERAKKESQQQQQSTNNSSANYGYSQYQNTHYNGPSYTTYNKNSASGKKAGNGLAIASMILGIVSLVLFCSCINLITAIIAIIMGIVFLANYNTASGKGMAIAGIVTAALSIVMLVGSYSMILDNPNLENLFDDEFFEYYYYSDDLLDDIGPFEEYYGRDDLDNFFDYNEDFDDTL